MTASTYMRDQFGAPDALAVPRPSDLQIAELARRAGVTGSRNLILATAICLWESSGEPRAYNGGDADHSFGLWQINMMDHRGPARRAEYRIGSNEDLYDPDVNARVMYHMSRRGQCWAPWATFSGDHLRRADPHARVHRAEQAVGQLLDGVPVSAFPVPPPWLPTVNAARVQPGRANPEVLVVQQGLAMVVPGFDFRGEAGEWRSLTCAAWDEWQVRQDAGGWSANGGKACLDPLSRLGNRAESGRFRFKATCHCVDDGRMKRYE